MLAGDQVWSRSATPIGRNFHCFPSLEEFDLQNLLGFAKPLHVRIGGRGARTWGWGKQGHAGMEPVVREERGQRYGRMLGIVVREFCLGEEAGPVGLLVVAEHAKVLLQHRVQPLRLPIRLRVERRRPVGLNPTELKEPP